MTLNDLLKAATSDNLSLDTEIEFEFDGSTLTIDDITEGSEVIVIYLIEN